MVRNVSPAVIAQATVRWELMLEPMHRKAKILYAPHALDVEYVPPFALEEF